MNYTIENDRLSVVVSDIGAQLQSVRRMSDGTEYLWQGDAAYWDERAPVLFPICGRLTDGTYTYEGHTYTMTPHGIVRGQVFAAEQVCASCVTFTLQQTEAMARAYPFSYIFRVRYELLGNTLRQHFIVENTGEDVLPFSYGGHPGFRVPVFAGEAFSDYTIVFDRGVAPQQVDISPTGYPTGRVMPFALSEGALALSHDLFDGAGIFLSDMGEGVTLRSRTHGDVLRVSFADMTHLGFWKPDHTDAPLVCIEPWHGLPATLGVVDDFATKACMCHLRVGGVHTAHIDITVM